VTRGLKGIGSYQQVQHVKVLSDCKPALYHLESMTLDRQFERVTTQWIPREENQVADHQSVKSPNHSHTAEDLYVLRT